MKKDNIFSGGKLKKVEARFFTGNVDVKEIFPENNSLNQKIYHVVFKKGARTKLHYHTGEQILIVTKGTGSLEFFDKIGSAKSKFSIKKKSRLNLKSGDIAHIPKKKFHTHGSVSVKETFSHIAINLYPVKNSEPQTIWYESNFHNKVTQKL